MHKMGISGLSFGSPKTKCHLDVSLVERHIVYYKGKGGGFYYYEIASAWSTLELKLRFHAR